MNAESVENKTKSAVNNIGRLLIAAGKLTESDVEKISLEQHAKNLRFGEAAIGLGLLSEEDILHALSNQFEYSYISVENANISPELVAAHQPYSRQGEALRALRSQLMLRWFGNNKKALALTGEPKEHGSSKIAANLAIVFSQLGEKTLLIDANLRNPTQHLLFGLDNQLGLSSVLAGRISYGDAVKKVDSFSNLSILCAGAVPPNPQELLSRTTFIEMQEMIANQYDIILYDTSPASESSDAQIVITRVGGCVMVVHRNVTKMSNALNIKEQIKATGAELVGVVMN